MGAKNQLQEIVPREENRVSQASVLYAVRFTLFTPGKESATEIVNYHHRGACLRLKNREFTHQELEDGWLSIHLGRKTIKDKLTFRVCWESLARDGLIGLEFFTPVGAHIHRPQRFPVRSLLPPILSASDPLDPNREVFFRILNISQTGLLLLTSLTNRHLLPGMQLTNATALFPGQRPAHADLQIENTRRSKRPGTFAVGVSIIKPRDNWQAAVKTYVSVLSPIEEGSRVEQLSSAGMLPKSVKKGLSYDVVEDETAYQKVLELRYQAYKFHGKVTAGATVKDQGDGLRKEGVIIAGYLGSELLASMELRFGDSLVPLRHRHLVEKHGKHNIDWNETVEINKFVIHPNAQGSDIVVGMIQKAHGILAAKGGLDIVIVATDALKPLYERIGFASMGIRIPHPYLSGQHLNVMLLKKETYLEGKYINIYAWHKIFGDNQKFAAALGLAESVELSGWKRFQIRAFSKLENWKRKISRT